MFLSPFVGLTSVLFKFLIIFTAKTYMRTEQKHLLLVVMSDLVLFISVTVSTICNYFSASAFEVSLCSGCKMFKSHMVHRVFLSYLLLCMLKTPGFSINNSLNK